MKKYFLGFLVIIFLAAGVFLWKSPYFEKIARKVVLSPNRQMASLAAAIKSPFLYTFRVDGILDEAGKMENSSSPYFWLNSGGRFHLSTGTGKTILGELPRYSKWRLAYAASNPTDTDNGYHPQNIFRILTRSKWGSFQQEYYFKIIKDNLSESSNRNASNGILLFNRYQNGNNLYYAGIRVDGAAVIKKKMNGIYYTMSYQPFYSGHKYNHDINPNLIPKNVWIGLRSEIKTSPEGTVNIKLYIDQNKTGNWVLAAEAKDDGKAYGEKIILDAGYAGIRTDFMDVEFDDYKVVKL